MNDNSSLTNVLVELDSNGNEKCYYTIGADLISQEVDGELSIYLYDGHGTVRGLADMDGKVTDTYDYDAFGNLISSTGDTVNNYRYCGEQFDSTTGLYYLRARYMDTNTGRFISMDTYQGSIFDPVSLHKYLYANANPINNCDPTGYSTQNIQDVTIVIIIFSPVLGSFQAEQQYDSWVRKTGLAIINALTIISPMLPYLNIWDNQIVYMMQELKDGIINFGNKARDLLDKVINEVQKNTKTSEDEEDITPTYYHATTLEKAIVIQTASVLIGSKDEAWHVFAWRKMPSKKILNLSGARSAEALVKFKTNAAFENDSGISDPQVKSYRPVVSVFPGPIMIHSVSLVPIF